MFDLKTYRREYMRKRRLNPEQKKREKLQFREYYYSHQEKMKERGRFYYHAHKEEDKLKRKEYRETHKFQIKISKANYIKRLRREILELLGNKCLRCEYNVDVRALEIDHVHGDGFIDRPNNKTNTSYYLKVLTKIKAGSKDYQCLCSNCNTIKKYDESEIWRHIKHDRKQGV